MYLKNILKDKKGAALEMAIFFMMIIFCFCTLLTTMTLTARSRIKIEKAYLNIDLNTDRVAEGYLLYLDDFNKKVLINGAAWDTDKSDVKINDAELKDQCTLINSLINQNKPAFFQIPTGVEGEAPLEFYTFASYIENKDLYDNYEVKKEEFVYNSATPDKITCKVTLEKNDGTKINIEVQFNRQNIVLEDPNTGDVLSSSFVVEKQILVLNKPS